jgi:hypothetical protein
MDWFAAAVQPSSESSGWLAHAAPRREIQKIVGGRAYILIFHLRSVYQSARDDFAAALSRAHAEKVHARDEIKFVVVIALVLRAAV